MIGEDRAAIVAAARAWIGTPYRLGAKVAGVGCDCATLIVGVLQSCQLMTDEQIEHFAQDWWAHSREDTYLLRMLRNAEKVADTVCRRSTNVDPGNIVLTRAARSRVFNHGGIITQWPRGVHSVKPRAMEVDFSLDPMWAGRAIVIFDPFRNQIC